MLIISRKFVVSLVLAVLFFPGFTLFSAESLSTEELRDLQLKLNARKELKLSFQQLRTSALRPLKPSKSKGNAVFSRPDRFRWEIESPQPDILVFDGKNLFNFKPGDTTATRYKTEGDRTREIKEVIDFVLDFDSLMKRYQLVESTKLANAVTLKLKPKTGSAISTVEIQVNTKSNYVQSLKMIFPNKNESSFEFSEPMPLKGDLTSFTPPAALKIVDGI
jgi:outer membrane lipoprotein-sorting protein